MREVTDWLEGLGLEKLAEVFAANDIDMDVLPEITEADLKDLGLSLGDRKRVLAAIRRLGTPDEQPAAAPAGARRQVTILFADLSGFTRLSEQLDAEEVHGLLQRFFAEADDAVRAFGGTIDKHIGDAVMAVFGAPVAHSDDPERAVRCALEIHGRLAAFDPPRQSHIGIASGQVVAGETGSSSFAEYTVTGPSVNLAARLQDMAKGGETLVSDQVKRAAERIVASEAVGEVAVKGIDRPIAVWRVLALADAGPAAASRAFVGRNRELVQLQGLIEACLTQRSGQLALLRGEPGIGKTRLTDRFQAMAEEAGFAAHSALVLDFGAGKGREAMPWLVRSLLSIPPGSSKDVRRAALSEACRSGLVREADRLHFNALLDLPQPSELRRLDEAMDSRTRSLGRSAALVRLTIGTAELGPLFLRIEDVHWADRELLEQLAALANAAAAVPLLIALTSRIEGDPIDSAWRSLIGSCPITTLDLAPLSAEDAFSLARSYIQADSEFMRGCIERAAGNPLFLDQLLQMADESAKEKIPGSVQSIVQSRMDRLDPEARTALEAAAVLGQRFAGDALAAMLEQTSYDCAALIEHRLVRPEGDGFLFAHALVREGVYATLLRDRRQDLHGRAAAWFQRRDTGLFAQHLEGAADPRAQAAYLAAAQAEAERHRLDAALRLIEAGLTLPGTEQAPFELTCLKGEVLRLLADSEGSIDCYQAAKALAESPEQEATACIGLAAGMRILDRFDQAFAQLDRAATLAEQAGRQAMLAEIWSMRGNLYFPLGRTDDCLSAHTKALGLAREAGATAAEVQAQGGLGDANYAKGRLPLARQHFANCVAIARQEGLGRIDVANAPMLAWTTLLTGDYAAGESLAEAARDQAIAAGGDRAAIIAYNALATLELDRGKVEQGIGYSDEIVRLSERLGSGRFASYGLNLLSQAKLMLAQHEEAVGYVERAWAEAERSAVGFCGPWILAVQARLARDRKEAGAALKRGEDILVAGAIAHNHFFYRREAMEVAVEWRDWQELERQALAFEAYLGSHRTSWTDYFIGRARLIAQRAQGGLDAAARLRQQHLLAYARTQGLAPSAQAISEEPPPAPE